MRRCENTCRKALAVSEALALGDRLEELERPKSNGRQGRPGQARCGKFPQQEQMGKTRDKVAASLGMSGKTYEKAKAVAAAAEVDPETFAAIAADMDRTGRP